MHYLVTLAGLMLSKVVFGRPAPMLFFQWVCPTLVHATYNWIVPDQFKLTRGLSVANTSALPPGALTPEEYDVRPKCHITSVSGCPIDVQAVLNEPHRIRLEYQQLGMECDREQPIYASSLWNNVKALLVRHCRPLKYSPTADFDQFRKEYMAAIMPELKRQMAKMVEEHTLAEWWSRFNLAKKRRYAQDNIS